MNFFSVKYFLLIILSVLLNGCGAFHDKMGQTNQVQVAAFVLNVRPILQNNCFSCHTLPSSPAGSVFYMFPSDSNQLYQESYRRINPGSPDSSRLLMKGMGTGHGGGNVLSSASDREKIREWISSYTESSQGNGSGTGGLFLNSVRPVLQTNCFGCHSQAGGAASTAYFMSSTDHQKLYDETFKRVIAGNPLNSLILTKGMGNAHAGGNQLPLPQQQNAIAEWIRSSEIGSGPGSGGGSGGGTSGGGDDISNLKFTASIAVPANLTLNGAYQYMRFSLSGLGHSGAFIEMGIRYYTEGGYEFSQWRVYSPSYPLKVTGLNILVSNGITQNFTNTLRTVILQAPQSQVNDSASNPLPGVLLSSRAGTGMVIRAVGDELKLAFTNVERSQGDSNPPSAEQMSFFNSVKPILLSNCTSCHGNTNGSGNFNMPNNDDTLLYQNVRLRVVAREPVNSRLYIKGTGTGHGGGNRLPNSADRDSIISWINMIQ